MEDIAHDSVRYSRNPAVLSASLVLADTDVGEGLDEMALLGATREEYFGLNGTAARIWQLLDEPRTMAHICHVLVQEYDADRAEIEHDVRECLAEMMASGLITQSP